MNQRSLRVPADLDSLVVRFSKGAFLRTDVAAAEAALEQLCISRSSEYYSFASKYCLGNIFPPENGQMLSDVCSPTLEVATGTRFVQEVWGLPAQYVCLTPCEGEGAVLLNHQTGEVFDFSLEDRDAFVNDPKATWQTFFEFMRQNLASPDEA